jgi:hypothetical protein
MVSYLENAMLYYVTRPSFMLRKILKKYTCSFRSIKFGRVTPMGILNITLYYVTWLASCVAKSVSFFVRTSDAGGERLKEEKNIEMYLYAVGGYTTINLDLKSLE